MSVVVSDHALLRYLERVKGVDVEAARAEIEADVEGAYSRGLVYYDNGRGLLYALAGQHVKTVMTKART